MNYFTNNIRNNTSSLIGYDAPKSVHKAKSKSIRYISTAVTKIIGGITNRDIRMLNANKLDRIITS